MTNIIVLILFIGSIVGLQQYGFPAWEQSKIHKQEIVELERVKTLAENSEKAKNDLLARLREIDQTKLDRLEGMFPSKLDVEGAYYFFQRLTEDSRMQLKSITLTDFGAEEDKSPFAEAKQGAKYMAFNINASGEYRSVRDLIGVLENNQRLMEIDSIGIAQGDKGAYSLTLGGKMYYGIK